MNLKNAYGKVIPYLDLRERGEAYLKARSKNKGPKSNFIDPSDQVREAKRLLRLNSLSESYFPVKEY